MRAPANCKSISFPVTVWFSPDTGDIQIARPTEEGFVTTINRREDSDRCHAHLYNALARALRSAGAPGPAIGPRLAEPKPEPEHEPEVAGSGG